MNSKETHTHTHKHYIYTIRGHGTLCIPLTVDLNSGTLYFLVMVYFNRNMKKWCLDYWCVFDVVHVLVWQKKVCTKTTLTLLARGSLSLVKKNRKLEIYCCRFW